MIIKVLGSAAGGGFPQWNCNGPNCSTVRAGEPGLHARTQSSLAVSADGRDWVLLNASPDIRQQIHAVPELHPHRNGAVRNSPIVAAVLTNGDVDHVAGLLSLREGHAFTLYATQRVLDALEANPIFNVLDRSKVRRRVMPLATSFAVDGPQGPTGIEIEAFSVPGKIALYLEDMSAGQTFGTVEGDTVGLRVGGPGGQGFFYVPGCAHVDEGLKRRLSGAALLFFDGTLYTDEEMIAQGLSPKTGGRMGHISMSGPDGSLATLADVEIGRRVYTHINNSNPVLREGSPERTAVEKAGWEVAWDGMDVRLS